jgi:hypothetical protein
MSDINYRYAGIGGLLAEGRLRVPVNQREYSWEEDHAIDLCNDFSDAIRNGKGSYFLGTVVLTESSNATLEVVDGQQRLATSSILLAAIRDICWSAKEERLVTSIENDYLFRIDPDSEQETPKLILNTKDHAYFLNRVLRRPDSPDRKAAASAVASSNRQILQVAKAVRRYLEETIKPLSESSKKDSLKQWLSFIRDKAKLIVLTVQDDVNAYVMFETLNDRGLKVSQADLVKNYLFGRAGDRIREAQTKWTSMVGILEQTAAEESSIDYLRTMCTLIGGLTREREVFTRIKERVSSQHAALQFIELLEVYANDYVAMLTPDYPKWNDYPTSIRRSLSTLDLFDVTQVRHLMLAVSHHFSKTEAEKAFRLFVNWIVRFFIAGAGRLGRVENVYAKLAHTIHTTNNLKTAKALAEQMSPNLAGDDEFKQAFSTAHVGQAKLARYYLDSMERKLVGEQHCDLVANEDTSIVNIEHVMPLNVTGEWNDGDPEVLANYARRLGNMVLLNARKNANLGDKSFAEKRAVYAESPFKLTEKVAAFETWGPDQINQRQRDLAEIAVGTWSIKVR